VVPRVTAEMNESLCKPYTKEEVKVALKQMHPHKAPGPDGLNPYFYQKFWDMVRKDVIAAVLAILNGHAIPPKLNHTWVTLIPKKPKPSLMGEFRPISLCDVRYKLVTKVISNRLKSVLPQVISESQAAFTPGKLITDNILIAYEAFFML